MRRSSQEQLLTLTQTQCLKCLQQQDEVYCKQRNSQSHMKSPTSSTPKIDPPPNQPDLHLQSHPQIHLLKHQLSLHQSARRTAVSLSESLLEFSSTFSQVQQASTQLASTIDKIQGDAANVLERQHRLVDLSVAVQETLDYYNYINKFKFQFQCELGQRELFEDQLQVILSELTEGIIFFESHPKFTYAKKYLEKYKSEKMKMLGFVRTFLLKLFNRQVSFSLKYNIPAALSQYFQSFTAQQAKPTVRFLCRYLSLFPQFKKRLQELVRRAKQQLTEQASKEFTLFQLQIQDFLASHSTISLIGYLQLNQKQIYSEVLAKFFLHHRTQLHTLLRNTSKPKPTIPIFSQFQQLTKSMVYNISSQYYYLTHCLNPRTADNQQLIRSTLATLSTSYYPLFKPILKQLTTCTEAYMFARHIAEIVDKLPSIIGKYRGREEYRVFPLGCVAAADGAGGGEGQLCEVLRLPFVSLLGDLEAIIQQLLPKTFTIKSTVSPSPQIQQFLKVLPYLKYSAGCSTRYIVSSLDQIIKSIKSLNTKFQSRLSCFLWNIPCIYSIRIALQSLKSQNHHLIRTQFSVDLQHTNSIVDRVRLLERTGSLWDYAKQFMSILSSSMPVINELTLDFSEYISTYLNELCQKFLKDMTFVYGKNMIEYLQRLDRLIKKMGEQGEQQEGVRMDLESMSQPAILKAEYEGLIVSIEKFVNQGIRKAEYKGYEVEGKIYGPDLLNTLAKKVFDNLLELISDFYILTAKVTKYEVIRDLAFQDISRIRQRLLDS